MLTVTEGEAPFHVPAAGKPCTTWYKIFGDISSSCPLIVLHGGPGMSHNYLLSLVDLAAHGTPVVFYDQLGNGLSTHLPEKREDAAFWTPQLFYDELANLLAHLGVREYDLLGQSWGGMLAAMHASGRPAGLRRLILSNSPADVPMWVAAVNKLRKALPRDVQDVLDKHEADGTTDSKEYGGAVGAFYTRHVCRIVPMPDDVQASLDWAEKDPTVYHIMNGPSEFHVIGTLKPWSLLSSIQNISVPTLLINGAYDEATDEVLFPFFHAIDKVKWVRFAESSHMPHWEERERYMEVVNEFLKA